MDHNGVAAKTPRSDVLYAGKAVQKSNEVDVDDKVGHFIKSIIQTFQPL